MCRHSTLNCVCFCVAVDSSSGSPWGGGTDEPCEPIDEQQRTALSNQQLAQLIRSLGLVEQVGEPNQVRFPLTRVGEDVSHFVQRVKARSLGPGRVDPAGIKLSTLSV